MTRLTVPLVTCMLALSVAAAGCVGLPGTRAGLPLTCDALGADADAQKIDAFLDTSARFEAQTLALAAEVEATCASMASDLGVPIPSAAEGQLQVDATCAALADEIGVIVDTALPREATLEVLYEEPVCTVDLDAMAICVASCDAEIEASNQVDCADTIDGRSCYGESSARADVQCEVACDAEISLRAECTEPSLEIYADVAVDVEAQARLDLLIRALDTHYPHFLSLEARVAEVAESGAELATTFADAADAAGRLHIRAMACFADATAVTARSVVTVNVTLSVSVEVSGSVSAGAHAG